MRSAESVHLPPAFDQLVAVIASATGLSTAEVRGSLGDIYRAGFADALNLSLDEALRQAASALGISAPLPRLTTRERGRT